MARKKTTASAKQGSRSRKSPSPKSKVSSDQLFAALKKKMRAFDAAQPRLKRDGDDA